MGNSAYTTIVSRAVDNAQAAPSTHAFEFLRDGEVIDGSLTWAQLDCRARAVGQRLAEMGMTGRNALLVFRPGLEFVEALYGCLYAGVVAVPAYPPRQNRHAERIELIAENAGVGVLLTTSSDLPLDPETGLTALPTVAIDQISDERAKGWQPQLVRPDALAILQYTSGSTGRPKGVMLTHENIVENCEHIQRAFATRPTDRGVSWLPTYHDMGLVGHVLETVWGRQLSILMPPVSFLQSPVRWLKAISKHGITISGGPNFAYELCVRKISDAALDGIDLSRWEVAYNGSEVVRVATLDRFCERFGPYGFRREAFYPCYGMAETTLIVSGGRRGEAPTTLELDRRAVAEGQALDASGDTDPMVLVSCGTSVIGEMRIVDPDSRQPLASNEIGEIWLTGDSIAQGYFQGDTETSHTFQATLADDPTGNQRFLRTGDLGFLRNGELFVTGRIKDLIKVRGVNRYPQDIEQSVDRAVVECVGQVAAFAYERDDEERLVVLVETEPLPIEEARRVVLAIRKTVAKDHAVQVDAVALVRKATIPRTSSGKTQRFECRQAFMDDTLDEYLRWENLNDSVPLNGISNGRPRSDVLNEVFAVVKEVAGDRVTTLTGESVLSELGLDSLERIEVATQLEQRFECVFSEAELRTTESCDALARLIAQKRNHHSVGHPHPQSSVTEFPEYQQLKRAQEALARQRLHNPFHQVHDGVARDQTTVEGKRLISFSTYNYLGMSGDPTVAAAAKRAIDQYGTSVSASRVVAGERPIHRQLEAELAAWLGTEDALVFVGGHATNETTIGHLVGPPDLILHDQLAHNSIMQGALLSGAQRRSFAHNDWEALDQLLTQMRSHYRRALVIIEGVYSMDGDFPDLPRFLEVCERHRCLLMVDEAHSLGTMGPTGRGIAEHFGVDPARVDIWMGTLSKALGSCGGYIAGSQPLIELLRYSAPGFVYSVGLSPPNAAAALAALHRLHTDPSLVQQCQANAEQFRSLAQAAGLDTGSSSKAPIVPIILGNSKQTLALAQQLHERGISVHPILYPAVPESAARLRFFISSTHTRRQIAHTVKVLHAEWQRLAELEPQTVDVESHEMGKRPALNVPTDTKPTDSAVNFVDNS